MTAVKTVSNIALRKLCAEALVTLLQHCSGSLLEKIIGNICLYIGNGKCDTSTNFAFDGGRLFLELLCEENAFLKICCPNREYN